MLRLSSTLALVSLTLTASLAQAGTVRQAEGTSAVVVEGNSSDAESKVGETLPEGSVITTGNDGRIVIEVAPGILLELQPDAELTIGAMDPDAGMDSTGVPIPRISVNLMSGGLVVHAAGDSLDATSVLVVTPKGNFSPASPGATLVSAASPTSPDGGVTVAAVTGSGIVTTSEGDQLALSDGMMVVLGSTAPSDAANISDSPQASQITEAGQSSAARIAGLAASPVGLARTSRAAPAPTPLPPRPTPTPSPTPLPPRPTPTPSPSPSPTPLPPRPTPTPSPSPSPTPLPPRPTPTPSPTPTPISP